MARPGMPASSPAAEDLQAGTCGREGRSGILRGMETPLDRFLRYVSFDTQSSAKTGSHPSTPGQLVLADAVADELRALGARNVSRSADGYVCATVPKIMLVSAS